MSRLDADALLRRALEQSADAAGMVLTIVRSASTRWASATFVGARHELAADLSPAADAEAWLAALPELDLPLRGHLLADLKVARISRAERGTAIVLEALTVEEC